MIQTTAPNRSPIASHALGCSGSGVGKKLKTIGIKIPAIKPINLVPPNPTLLSAALLKSTPSYTFVFLLCRKCYDPLSVQSPSPFCRSNSFCMASRQYAFCCRSCPPRQFQKTHICIFRILLPPIKCIELFHESQTKFLSKTYIFFSALASVFVILHSTSSGIVLYLP